MSQEFYKTNAELTREKQPLSEMRFKIVLLSPVLLPDKATLRFCIGFQLVDSDKLLGWMEGWRVLNGKLMVPSRKAGLGYYPFWKFNSNRAEDVIIDLLECWRDDYPSVIFPSGGEFK